MPIMAQQPTEILLSAAASTGAGTTYQVRVHSEKRAYQAWVAGSGAVSATIVVEVSNDGAIWSTRGTISLTGTTLASDVFADVGNWPFVRGNVTAISGTGAAVSLTMTTN